ncbi:MAG: C40 family peptidase [Bacteroidales bacterium]|nr:C40 family peptidase [Bacteroidales bacterium]
MLIFLALALLFAGRAGAQEVTPAQDSIPVQASDSLLVQEPVVTADDIIAYARTFTGTPYRLGADGPKEFDCSSFTHYVFKHFGYELTSYSVVQFREGRPVDSYFQLKKGDLVFFGKRVGVREIGHVGIVVSVDKERGSFTFIHASSSKGVIEQTSSHPYFLMRYMGARRILPDE